MHNAAFAALGIDAGVYVPCEAASFDDFLGLAEALPIAGASVTAPFKEAAGRRSVATEREAGGRRARSTRCGDAADGGWEGLNTDVDGFLAPLGDIDAPRCARRPCSARAARRGRSSRACAAGRAQSVCTHGVRRRCGAGASELGVERRAVAAGRPAVWDVLVNTTPVGTHPAVDDTPHGRLMRSTGRLVYDLVYNPRPTRLLREAAARGCRTIDGLDMLVRAGASGSSRGGPA